jgi:peptidoglycan LD-endopeptidase CwlK
VPSRRIEDLHPDLQARARAHIAACEEIWPGKDIDVFITCTYRSPDEQNALYALGRTVKSHVGPWSDSRPLGSVVTRARGGQSSHNYQINGKPAALAYDIAIIVHGKLLWDLRSPLWQKAGQVGMDLGLAWYGAPGSPFKEGPHFQHPLSRDLMRGVHG